MHVSDSAITTKVMAALRRSKSVKSADLHVETVGGIVTLSGTLDDGRQVTRVTEIAARVKGVKNRQPTDGTACAGP